jgi:plastocyanin
MSGRKLGLLVAVAAVGSMALPFAPAQAAVEVSVSDDAFSPAQASSAVGGQVHWSRGAGSTDDHNIRQDDMLFFSGAPTSGPIDFTASFSAGTYHYYCEEHGSEFGGMDGTVSSPVRILNAPPGRTFTVRWATANTDTGSVFDVQFRIGSGPWRNWRQDVSATQGVFGKNGNPVNVQNGKVYRFRARSQEGTAVSGWSPIRSKTG